MKLESLTPEQERRLPEFAEKWTKIGLCTDPADRPRAEAGINKAYEIAGLDPPKRIVWCGSPLSAGLSRALVLGLEDGEASVRASVRASVGASVWDSVGASVRASVRDSEYGQHDASWLGFYDYFRQCCGLGEQTSRLVGMWEVAKSAGWWLPHREACWVSERHSVVEKNEGGALHCDDGPAIAYPDGWEIYAIDGIRVPREVVISPESQTVEAMDSEENSDVRSIRIQRFGWARYLKESGAEAIDDAKNYVTGCPEALYRTKRGEKRLVAVCPTGRTFAMGVPEEIVTCEQAQRWLGPQGINIIAAT